MSAQPIVIDQKIVSWQVVTDQTAPAPAPVQSFERPRIIEGNTYKIKPPTHNAAIYVTINHVVLPDGTKRPLEVFINSKNVEHQQWAIALMRVMSALFRKPGAFEFMIEELEQIHDPQGGYFEDQRFQPSVVAHIGRLLREHCERIGAIKKPELAVEQQVFIDEKRAEAEAKGIKGEKCSKCNENSAVMMDGCLTCTSCGFSKCG